VFVEITEATLQALPGILNPGRDGYDDNIVSIPSQRAAVEDLFESPITPKTIHRVQIIHNLEPPGHTRRHAYTADHTNRTTAPAASGLCAPGDLTGQAPRGEDWGR